MYITVIHSEVEIYRLPKSAYEKSIVSNPLLKAATLTAVTSLSGSLFHSATTRTGKQCARTLIRE